MGMEGDLCGGGSIIHRLVLAWGVRGCVEVQEGSIQVAIHFAGALVEQACTSRKCAEAVSTGLNIIHDMQAMSPAFASLLASL